VSSDLIANPPSGTIIVGATNVNEVYTVNGGAIITAPIIVINGTLSFEANASNSSAIITVRSSIYILNYAKFYIFGAQVNW
jgi:hypothetical protein